MKNVNQFTRSSGDLCLKFRQVPGALLVTDMHKANVSNVFVDRLYDIREAAKSGPWMSVVSLYQVESAFVRSCALNRVVANLRHLVRIPAHKPEKPSRSQY